MEMGTLREIKTKMKADPDWNKTLLRTFYVIISVPFASTCALMAQEHHGQANLAARGVALSTVLSVISLPVVGMIFGM